MEIDSLACGFEPFSYKLPLILSITQLCVSEQYCYNLGETLSKKYSQPFLSSPNNVLKAPNFSLFFKISLIQSCSTCFLFITLSILLKRERLFKICYFSANFLGSSLLSFKTARLKIYIVSMPAGLNSTDKSSRGART